MFCKNCKKPLPDEPMAATVCAQTVASSKSKRKRLVVVAVVAVAVIAAGLIFYRIPKRYNSPEKVAKAYALAEYTYDAEHILDCVPDFFLKDVFGDISRKEMVDSLNSQETLDRYLSCKILSAVRNEDNAEAQAFKENVVLREYQGTEIYPVINAINDYCFVTVKAEVDDNVDEQNLFCILYNNSWYVLPIG